MAVKDSKSRARFGLSCSVSRWCLVDKMSYMSVEAQLKSKPLRHPVVDAKTVHDDAVAQGDFVVYSFNTKQEREDFLVQLFEARGWSRAAVTNSMRYLLACGGHHLPLRPKQYDALKQRRSKARGKPEKEKAVLKAQEEVRGAQAARDDAIARLLQARSDKDNKLQVLNQLSKSSSGGPGSAVFREMKTHVSQLNDTIPALESAADGAVQLYEEAVRKKKALTTTSRVRRGAITADAVEVAELTAVGCPYAVIVPPDTGADHVTILSKYNVDVKKRKRNLEMRAKFFAIEIGKHNVACAHLSELGILPNGGHLKFPPLVEWARSMSVASTVHITHRILESHKLVLYGETGNAGR